MLSASKATLTTFDDRVFPAYDSIFAALKLLPAVAPWMLSCNHLTLVPPDDRVYCMEGLLLFPSRQDFIEFETPAQFASMAKPACVNILQSGALFALLGNTVPQLGNVHPDILKLKVNEMRVKISSPWHSWPERSPPNTTYLVASAIAISFTSSTTPARWKA